MSKMKIAVTLSLLLLLQLCSFDSFALGQSFCFSHWSVEDGMPQSSAISVLQDSQGFLWVGTQDGLARYDGYNFRVFKNHSDDPHSLSANFIWDIFEDSQGYLWIGTNGGLNRFDPKTEQFSRYRYEATNPNSLSNDVVYTITEDRNGILWLGTHGGGLNRFNPNTEQFKHFRNDASQPNSISSDIIRDLTIDSKGLLWIGSDGGGLSKFNQTTDTFSHHRFDANNPNSISHDYVYSITEDNTGMIWAGTYGGGLNRFNPQTNKFTHYRAKAGEPNSLSNDFIRTVMQDSQGSLWIGTEGGGLSRLNIKSEQFSQHRFDAMNPNSLSHHTVRAITEDRQGIIWLGTDGGGLNRFNPKTEQFGYYRSNVNDVNSLSADIVRAMTEDREGALWVGTSRGGLDRFNPNKKLVDHFRADPEQQNESSLSKDNVRSITEDHTGLIWVGTKGGGLNRLDPKTKKFNHFRYDRNNPNSLSNDIVMAITEDQQKTLWVGTEGGGLNRFDQKTEQFKHYRYDAHNPNSLSHNMVRAITEDRYGALWVGTDGGGLNKFNAKTEQFSHYRFDASNPDSLSNDVVYSITEDHHGTIWVGTTKGLNKMDKLRGTFKHFTEKDGLPNDVIYRIEEDNRGMLWLSTNRGLSRFNPKTEQFKNYDAGDCLQSDEFNTGASFKSKRGELFFGGIKGFNRFFPNLINDDTLKPIVVITDMLLSNQSVPIRPESNTAEHEITSSKNKFMLEQATHSTSAITLTHKENLVSFEFSALHFSNPKKNQYAYQLEGFDSDWITTDHTKRFATYTNLNSGNYVLRVKASNPDGVWNEEGTSLSITVLPPPWKSLWAYIFYTILLVAAVFTFVRTQRKKVHYERSVNRELKRIDKLKDEFLANTSHELRTPINGIIGMSESLIFGATDELSPNTIDSLKMVVESGRRLSDLVNNILDCSELKSHQVLIQTKPIILKATVETTMAISHWLLKNSNVEVVIDIPQDLPLVEADENRLQQILSHLIGNAIKFTQSGSVKIRAKQHEHFIIVQIIDTGIGIPANMQQEIFQFFQQVDGSSTRAFEGAGLGLTITKQLIELHGGTISVSSEVNIGTTFTFSLPVSEQS